MMATFFYLLGWHALADYVLQPPDMVRRKHPPELFGSMDTAEEGQYGPWWWWMTAHSLINGVGVGVLTTWHLGIAETVVHGLTDYAKCRGWLTTVHDQGVHIGSKLLWAWLG